MLSPKIKPGNERWLWPVLAAVLFSLALPINSPPGPGHGGDQTAVYLRAVGVGPIEINAPSEDMTVVNLEPLTNEFMKRFGFTSPVPIGEIPLPYVDFLFEYPPLPALEFTLDAAVASGVPVPPPSRALPPYQLRFFVLPLTALVCVSVGLALEFGLNYLYVIALITAALNVLVLVETTEPVFRLYYTHSIVCAFLYPMTLYEARKLADKLSRSGSFWMVVLSPTMLFFSTRNWDLMAAVPFLAGLNRVLEGDRRSGIALATVSVSAKPVTLVPLGMMVLATTKGTVIKRVGAAGGVVTASLLPYSLIPAISFKGFEAFLWWFSHWYCELGIWQLFRLMDPELSVQAAKAMSTCAEIGLSGLVAWRVVGARKITEERLVAAVMSSEAFFLSMSWIFPPQMMIYLVTLRPVLREGSTRTVFTLADMLNSSIVILIGFPPEGFLAGEIRNFLVLFVGARVLGYLRGNSG